MSIIAVQVSQMINLDDSLLTGLFFKASDI